MKAKSWEPLCYDNIQWQKAIYTLVQTHKAIHSSNVGKENKVNNYR